MEHTLEQVEMTFGQLEALMLKYNQGLVQRLGNFKHQMCNSKGLTPQEKKRDAQKRCQFAQDHKDERGALKSAELKLGIFIVSFVCANIEWDS